MMLLRSGRVSEFLANGIREWANDIRGGGNSICPIHVS